MSRPVRLDDETRLEAARAFAQWHLGSRGWADQILRAYANPEETWVILADEGMEAASRRMGRGDKSAPPSV